MAAILSNIDLKEDGKSGLRITEGVLHITVKNGNCSGSFEGEGKNTVEGIKYEAMGSFDNVLLHKKN
jgi:hypothetical protein